MPTRPLTEKDLGLMHAETIISQLPVSFPNGNSFDQFTGTCAFCGKDIPDECLKGRVSRPIDTVANIEAIGICLECEKATPFNCRIRDCLRMEFVSRDGNWLASFPNGPTVPLQMVDHINLNKRWDQRILETFRRTPRNKIVGLALMIAGVIFCLTEILGK